MREIETLKDDLHKVEMQFEQWEVIYCELLQLEDEVVSGRLQRGETPQAAGSNSATESGHIAPTASPLKGLFSGEGKKNAAPNGVPYDQIAITGALLLLYAWWQRRRERVD